MASSDIMDVVQVVSTFNQTQNAWLKETRELRETRLLAALSAFGARLQSHREPLAKTIAEETGMPIFFARTRSVDAAIFVVDETIELAKKNFAPGVPRAPSTGHSAVLLGWTNPLLSFVRRVPAILISGGAVCVKPSTLTEKTIAQVAGLLTESLKEAQVPEGLFATLTGPGVARTENDEAVGDLLLKHPGFKTIFWIGRTDSALRARVVAEEAGKRFHFVGSGRNPAILFAGAEDAYGGLEALAKEWALAIVDPHGLGPYRPSRFFIQDPIYTSFIDHLKNALEVLPVGDPLNEATRVGVLPPREVERFQAQFTMATGEGGRIVTGGEVQGNLVRPGLIRDLTNCSTLQSEELAGPWATIASFKYAHDALKYANTSPLGLGAYVLHADREKAKVTAEKLETARIFYQALPPWPGAVTRKVSAVKQSAGEIDGLDAIMSFSRWSATHFD